MAQLVLGIGTSHGPMLATPPELWHLRADADRKNARHFYRGETYDFARLLEARPEHFADRITPEERRKRYDSCQRALDALRAKYREVNPDLVVVVGNDQRELFADDNTPSFLVFTGPTVENIPLSDEQKLKLPPGIAVAEEGHCPPGGAVYRGAPNFAVGLVHSLIEQEFDVSESARLPQPGGHEHGIPHAFGFLVRRIMSDNPAPIVPVFLNAGIPHNQPTIKRCLKFGRALARAIQDWKEDIKVALFASGGLTHFVIDEELDQRILKAMKNGDEAALEAIPASMLLGNTCEIRNWLPVSAAMNSLGKKMTIVDYVACYRSEAGTGNAMGFAYWE